MSGSVDDRVVAMKFDNSQFATGVAQASSTLDKLKKSLDFTSSKKNVENLQSSVSKFNLGGLSNIGATVDGVSTKFLALSTIGITALADLTKRALDSAIRIGKSFTTGPISDGFRNYETQITAVQTILANTGLEGAAGLGQVNKALEQLNTYANQTVYNFSDMAKNIGTFTAAGVKLQPATDAIKGIANLAALSGSTAEQASAVMYQLSQAVASNKVGAQDWISVVNAGIGGKVFQKALFDTANQLGTIKGVKVGESFDAWTKKGNTFKELMATGAITGTVLTKTLAQFTGDLTDQQLKAQGYTATQIKDIQKLAKTANNAATQIKTFTQLKAALKEEVATAYAAIFKTVFGDINSATKLFSSIHTAVENALTTPIYRLNTILEQTAKLGGRAKVIQGFKNVFKDLGAVLKPIKEAFREFFPATTAKQLYAFTVGFQNLTSYLKIGADTASKIKRTFAGVFAVFDIARMIIDRLALVAFDLFSIMHTGSGSFLNLTAKVGDFIVALDKTLKSGTGLDTFFRNLTAILAAPIQAMQEFKGIIVNLFDGFDKKDIDNIGAGFGRVTDRLKPLEELAGRIGKVFTFLGTAFTKIGHAIAPVVKIVTDAMNNVGKALAGAFSSGNFNGILDAINTGLLGGIALLIAKWLKKGISVDVGGGVFGSVKEAFEGLTGTLKTMQTSVKADIILKIAAAVALLTVSIVALSLIDSDKLAKALAGIGVAFAELLGAMFILTKITGTSGFLKMPAIGLALNLLASAILILAFAVRTLSTLSWEELLKGLGAVAVILVALVLATKPLSANSAGMITAGLGITAIAVGINILAAAVAIFGQMDWETIAKGLTGVTVSLLAIAGAMKLMPKGIFGQAAAILVLSGALLVLAKAVQAFAAMSLQTIGRGLGEIAASLVVIGTAMRLMPKDMIVKAKALVLVSASLLLITQAISTLGNMNIKKVGQGIAAVALALGVLALALSLMDASVSGSAALVIAAAAITLLVPAITALGLLPLSVIVQGISALAAIFIVIGLSALVLAPLIPAVLGLAAALALIAIAMAIAGGAALLFATAFATFASVGSAGVALAVTAFKALLDLLPYAATKLAEALVGFIGTIAKHSPEIVASFIQILDAMLDGVTKMLPKLAVLIGKVVDTVISVITNNVPKLVKAGFTILISVINGIANNIGKVLDAGANLIIKFVAGIASNTIKVVNAAGQIIVDFLNGLSAAIRKYEPEIIRAGAGVGVAIVEGIVSGLSGLGEAAFNKLKSGIGGAFNKAKGFIGSLGSPAKMFMPIGESISLGVAVGVSDHSDLLTTSVIGVVNDAKDALANTIKDMPNILEGITNTNPTITPVLDLTEVVKGASVLSNLVNTNSKLSAGVTINHADALLASMNDNSDSSDNTGDGSTDSGSTTFVQNNYSPKSLSTIDIYRQTKNQISLAKGALPA